MYRQILSCEGKEVLKHNIVLWSYGTKTQIIFHPTLLIPKKSRHHIMIISLLHEHPMNAPSWTMYMWLISCCLVHDTKLKSMDLQSILYVARSLELPAVDA